MSQEVTENILKIKTSILPTVDLGASIGSNSLRFSSIYANSFIGNFTPVGLTPGGILFSDLLGAISQDTTNLSWDNSTKILSTKNLSVTLNALIGGTLGVTGNTNLASLNCSGNAIFGGLITTTFTNGSVPFITGSGDLTQNNIKFYWDNTNFRLGINTTTPSDSIEVVGGIKYSTFLTTPMNSGSVMFLDSSSRLAQNNTKLFWSDTNERLGIGTNLPTACLHIATTGVATSDYILVQGPGPANGMIMNNQGLMAINGNTVSSAQLAVTSTNKGFLGPVMNQTQKFAILSPVQGLEVYDSTINSKSYYNGINWFIPSFLIFSLSTAVQCSSTSSGGTLVPWNTSESSPDNRITFSSTTLTISDIGIYELNLCCNFAQANSDGSEARCEINFSAVGGTLLARGTDQVIVTDGVTGTGSASICYLLTTTVENSIFEFKAASATGGSPTLFAELINTSKGYIKRIL
jgi:hypothetical protein